jgi:hypothetical protein
MTEKTTAYWGILCRTCSELVAFDKGPYHSFGPEAASMRPGAILCGQGHNHIYFPNDFHFIPSAVRIPDAVMERNRDVYRAVNPRPVYPEQPSDLKKHVKSEVATPGSDATRETVREDARQRWSDWANKKAM